jgi:PGF-pre-PGF domain-containing protein
MGRKGLQIKVNGVEPTMDKARHPRMFALAGLLLLASALAFAQPARAAVTVSMTAPSSVTQGSNIPVSVSFTVGTGDSGTFYFTCDQTSSGEVSPESGYSISASTSKTYTFTPSQAQTYTNCKVSDGGTQSSSAATITAIAPTTLTVAGSPSSSTSSSFTLGINITNPTTGSVTTSYALSGCGTVGSCSGDQTSATIAIGSGSATSLSWTVTATSSGTLAFQLGSNSNAFSATVTITSAVTTTTTTAPAGQGSRATATTLGTGTTTTTTMPVKETKLVAGVAAGGTAKFEFQNADALKIQSVSIVAGKALSNVAVTIEDAALPSGADVPVAAAAGNVYKYLKLEKTAFTDSDITSAKIKFKVENSWLAANNIDKSKVALYRYADSAWSKLATAKLSEDASYAYYEAETAKLSTFAIAGEKAVAAGGAVQAPAGLQLEWWQWALIALLLIAAAVLVAVKLGYVDLDMLFYRLKVLLGRRAW